MPIMDNDHKYYFTICGRICVKTAQTNWTKFKFYDINSIHRDKDGYQDMTLVFENYQLTISAVN